ncbi:N-acetylmuramoyl-L-alanine amidase [Ruegeria marina]|uniref:N-acetylmuramoyl-L-alanine amidase n=1 Tax=Ruegeria marina TaxID=639004 RepID=A0A1G6QB61_9RHOB|nr:N-acetylmuramoyl-L-alanine amidase [Ruegeria marina]SDC88905.1 N-acetylmuramoyl-L-alanine amidase [Ruegeria marina]
MSRIISFIVALWALAAPSLAQDFSGLARLRAEETLAVQAQRGAVRIAMTLSQGVPFRLFTLDAPRRLVLDFQEVDWTGLRADMLLVDEAISGVHYGSYVPGWSRMVLELARPLVVSEAAMNVDNVTGEARLTVMLQPAGEQEFAAGTGAPSDPRWDLPAPQDLPALPERAPDAPLRVVLDPGHGGIDPGAEVEGVVEKELMLRFARELQDLLLRSGGFEVILTRDTDVFVSLERRVALAHEAGADVFLSLHADSLSEGMAHGATVHVLAEEASDVASAKLAERHDRDDLLAGVDLSETDDKVTDVLLDLARQETRPRTEALARALVDGMAQQGGPMNRRPLRAASFSVLKAADIPSVLVEVGFLSSPRDLKNLQDDNWRAAMAAGIRNGLMNWRKADLENRSLVRQ